MTTTAGGARAQIHIHTPPTTTHAPPPDSTSTMSASCLAVICSQAARFAEMSSRIAACGQPPVSIAWMRSGSSAECRSRNSPSSCVKMSLVICFGFWVFFRGWEGLCINNTGGDGGGGWIDVVVYTTHAPRRRSGRGGGPGRGRTSAPSCPSRRARRCPQ